MLFLNLLLSLIWYETLNLYALLNLLLGLQKDETLTNSAQKILDLTQNEILFYDVQNPKPGSR